MKPSKKWQIIKRTKLTETLKITRVNGVFNRIDCDRGVQRELAEEFSFLIENARFNPKVKNKVWDGRIRLYDARTRTMYGGLLNKVLKFARDREYTVEIDYKTFAETEFSLSEANDFIKEVIENAKIDLDVRDYQVDTFVDCIRKNRRLFVSPTSSGKSFMIYLIVKFYLEAYGLSTLIITDSTAAVSQLAGDFVSYGENPETIHKIFGGQDKNTKHKIIISTWQSLMEMDPEWFERFHVVVGDEAHHYQAAACKKIMEATTTCIYRFGFTGTLDGIPTNKLTLEGLFGPTKQIVTTKQLQEAGYVADIDIKCIVLQYSEQQKILMKKAEYKDEAQFLVSHVARNRFIKNLALSLKGNTLIFFQFVEKHGKVISELLKDDEKGRDHHLYFIHGEVDGEFRNDVRQELEKYDDCIAVVSYGTFQTAVSIKNIHNMIFAFPSKSRIRNLQSIGRGIRKSETKDKVVLFDIADNLIVGSWKNHTIKHFGERIKIYSEEGFKPSIHNVTLQEK